MNSETKKIINLSYWLSLNKKLNTENKKCENEYLINNVLIECATKNDDTILKLLNKEEIKLKLLQKLLNETNLIENVRKEVEEDIKETKIIMATYSKVLIERNL